MIVHCIHINDHTDAPHRGKRKESIIRQCDQQGLQIQFWPGIIDKPPFKGIAKAHKQIIQWAKDSDLSEVVIIEDDAVFTSSDAFMYYQSQKPMTFDLYLGGVYSAQIQNGRILNGFSGITMYTVSKRFYDVALNIRDDWHFDRAMGCLASERAYYVCEPFVVYQFGEYSDNQRKKVNYDAYHKQFEFYKNRPPLTTGP